MQAGIAQDSVSFEGEPIVLRAVPDATGLVECAVRDLRDLVRLAGIQAAVDVGAYILDRFYGGDYEAFCDPDPLKSLSFRELCRRDDLPISEASLRRAVHLHDQVRRLPSAVSNELTVAHHRALLPVRTDDRREKLARQAISEGWTSVKLSAAVREELPKTRVGRKPTPPVTRHVGQLTRAAKDLALAAGKVAAGGAAERIVAENALLDLDAAIALLVQTRDRLQASVQ